eukprot:Lithocolla_globosa_v1_NODE_1329_length_2666_cov_9.378782.p4 type:complete len:109 gc:universal NODE_1329_length_2666_cov_9.378782:1286-1612(+)
MLVSQLKFAWGCSVFFGQRVLEGGGSHAFGGGGGGIVDQQVGPTGGHHIFAVARHIDADDGVAQPRELDNGTLPVFLCARVRIQGFVDADIPLFASNGQPSIVGCSQA